MSRATAFISAVCLLVFAPGGDRGMLHSYNISSGHGMEHGRLPGSPIKVTVARDASPDWSDVLPSLPTHGEQQNPRAFAEWLDAMAEPRVMTALAASAYPSGDDAAPRPDPERMRNWSEFSDPYLYLRWRLAGGEPSLRRAIVNDTLADAAAAPALPAPVDATWLRLPGQKNHQDTSPRLRF